MWKRRSRRQIWRKNNNTRTLIVILISTRMGSNNRQWRRPWRLLTARSTYWGYQRSRTRSLKNTQCSRSKKIIVDPKKITNGFSGVNIRNRSMSLGSKNTSYWQWPFPQGNPSTPWSSRWSVNYVECVWSTWEMCSYTWRKYMERISISFVPIAPNISRPWTCWLIIW